MSSIFSGKPPRALRMLQNLGVEALKYKMEKGKYIGPTVSRRVASNIRKRAVLEGTYGSFSTVYGGWDPSWEKRKRIYLVKPFKGHIRDRTRASRAEKITNAMKAMPDRIAKYKQELQEKKPVKDLLHKFNWVTSLHSRR